MSAATAAIGKHAFAQSAHTPADAAPVTFTLHPDQPGPAIPASFIGLSYETQQLSDPNFFSPANSGLIAQFRALSPCGVLRLGGNTSDIGWWKPTPATPKPSMANMHPDGEAGEPTADLAYSITPQAVVNLRAFLEATGWTCLYGINLGTNTPAAAAEQAEFVAKTLGWVSRGGRLEYLQLGNEPDLFGRHMRDPKTWTADAYFTEWLAAANAILARVHAARFGLPDTAGNPEWYARVVDRLLAIPEGPCAWCGRDTRACGCAALEHTPGTRPPVAALSHHYYFSGPPSNPAVNIPDLLQHDPYVDKLAADIRAAAARLDAAMAPPAHLDAAMARPRPAVLTAHTPYRMTEGNTCFRGGKPGVSDVFAAALWAADYALQLASFGYAGINLHGGTGQFVANSLGGHLPGDDIVAAQHGDPATHPHPYYTPIASFPGKAGTQYLLEPVGYGLLFAGQFAGGTVIPVDLKTSPGNNPVNVTAYAAQLPTGQTILAIINKDATRPLHIDVPGYSLARTLTAASLDARTVHYEEPSTNREVSIVAPASAVLLQSTHA